MNYNINGESILSVIELHGLIGRVINSMSIKDTDTLINSQTKGNVNNYEIFMISNDVNLLKCMEMPCDIKMCGDNHGAILRFNNNDLMNVTKEKHLSISNTKIVAIFKQFFYRS